MEPKLAPRRSSLVGVNLTVETYETVKAFQMRLRMEDGERYSISEVLEYLVWRGMAVQS